MLQSYLNMLRILQVSDGISLPQLKFKIKVKPVVDEDVVQKVNTRIEKAFSIAQSYQMVFLCS